MEFAIKSKIAFINLPNEIKSYLVSNLSVDYNVVELKDIESLASEEPTPLAVIVGLCAVDWPLNTWCERVEFFSGGAEIFVAGETERLDNGKKNECVEMQKNGRCCFIAPDMIHKGCFLYNLQKAYIIRDYAKQISLFMQSGGGEEVHEELEFRTKALLREKDFSDNIINSITSGLMVIEAEGNLVKLNNEAEKLLNVGQRDYLAVHHSEVFEKPIAEVIEKMSMQSIESHGRSSEIVSISENLIVAWTCYPIYEPGGNFIGTMHFIDDVTVQENTERQLIQAEKLATIGTMLSGIAHELRNPLSIISGRSQRLLEKRDKFDEWTVRYIQSIDDQVTRCGQIVNNLLRLSRKEAVGFDYNNLNAILDEVLTYVDYQNIFDRITVVKNYASDPVIYCNRSQLLQVFLNLIGNAADAMNGQGALTLTTADFGNRAMISVMDTGGGIAPKIISKIFDPFFTTKEAGKGTGLGLAIVYRIIQQHGGTINVRSKPGETVFDVILPKWRRKDGEQKNTSG